MKTPKRGEIYWVSLDPAIGSEIRKTRPCLVVSNNLGNDNSDRVIVAPITSNVTRVYSFEVILEKELDKPCKVTVDQIRCVDKTRLGKRLAVISKSKQSAVDKALRIVLDIQ